MVDPIPLLRALLLIVLLAPLGAGIVCGLAAAKGRNPRRFAMWFSLLHLGATIIVLGGACVELTERTDTTSVGRPRWRPDSAFRPIAVPGDPGIANDPNSQQHTTLWSLLPIGNQPGPDSHLPPSAVQFFIGVDGLNVWLVALTSLMMVIAVLLSLDSVKDRPAGFYAWLFVLQTGVTGAFLAFDVILFYVFFELTLIPAYFLIGSWGIGGARRDAARKFFLYTLFGSLFTLTGLVGIVLTNPTPLHPTVQNDRVTNILPIGPNNRIGLPREGPITFAIPQLMKNVETWSLGHWVIARQTNQDVETATQQLNQLKSARTPDAQAIALAESNLATAEKAHEDARANWDNHKLVQAWLFLALIIGFAVKVPIVPFHTWLPGAYGEAPLPVTMLLSAVMAKLGTYGILRLVLPLTPDAALAYGLPVIGTLGAIGIIYAAFCAYAQRDIKLLTAYSSISHLGFLVIALFTFNAEGVAGSTLHMVNHGLSTGAMFGLLVFLSKRYQTLEMHKYSGLWARYPGYTFLMIVICLASIGVPGLNNFVSEMLMLAGLFDPSVNKQWGYGLSAAAAVGILLSSWYTLTMIRRVFFGPLQEPEAQTNVNASLTGRELFAYGSPVLLCLIIGLFPQTILNSMKADVEIVSQAGEHARKRSNTFVDRTPRRTTTSAIIGAPGGAVMQPMVQPQPQPRPKANVVPPQPIPPAPK